MKLESVELRLIKLSLVAPFETSFGVQTERNVLLLKAVTDQGGGWAECVAGDQSPYSSRSAFAPGATPILPLGAPAPCPWPAISDAIAVPWSPQSELPRLAPSG